MTHISFSSLRVRLCLLVFLALVPALGLMLYTASEQRRRGTVEVQEYALRLALLTSLDHERLIEGARQLLVALARLPEVHRGDSTVCNALFADLLKQYPRYANFGAIKANGDLFCSALPTFYPINLSDRAYFRDAVDTRDFAVGEFQIGRVTLKRSMNFGYPVLNEAGQVQAVVFAALDLAWLNQLAAAAQLPEGALLSIVDHNGAILAHHPNPERWVGKGVAEAPIVEAILAYGGYTAELPGVDGVPRLYAFTKLRSQYKAGYISIGIPQAVAYAPANRTLVRNLAGLGLAGVSALVAAWVGSNVFILRRVNALVSATKRLSAGDLNARTGLPLGQGELGQLARAFDDMADSLERHQEQRLLEEQLRRQNEELAEQNRRVQEVNRLKSEFVSLVSHELRTPLTSITGYVELLLAGEIGELTEGQREVLGIVMSNAERQVELIDDLLDISRIEAGKVDLKRSSLDLVHLIHGVASLLRPQIDAKRQLLTLDLAEVLPAVLGDADRVTQILTNLLSNAHKYTLHGGSITVAARREDGWVRVDVQDSGIGLSADEQAQLFTQFFRAQNPVTPEVGGTGLGLAITRSLVEMHGGEITVTSAPGQGSTFSFTLPATQNIQ